MLERFDRYVAKRVLLESFDRLLVVAIEHPYIGGAVSGRASAALSAIAVSYTHLTLPTIYSV